MELKNFIARVADGEIVPGATYYVYLADTLTLANIYDKDGIAIANPGTASASGQIAFAAAYGDYDLRVTDGLTLDNSMRVRFSDSVTEFRADLANDSDPAKGAALVGYNGQTVADALDDINSTLSTTIRAFDSKSSAAGYTSHSVGDVIQIVGGDQYAISTTVVNGGIETPDCFAVSGGLYAIKVLNSGLRSRSGTFVTAPELGHRAGQIIYTKTPSGKVDIISDLNRLKPNTNTDFAASIAYVDWSRPDDLGDGLTWATAKKSIGVGIALGADITLVRGGHYSRANRMASFSVSKDRAIIAVGGPVVQGTLALGTWAKEGGYTNVYKLTYASGLTNVTAAVFDRLVPNNSAPKSLSAVASIALVDSTPGSFYHTGTTTYVHPADSRNLLLDTSTVVCLQPVAGPEITYTGDFKLYMEGIECWYAGTGGSDNVRLLGNGSQHLGSVFYNKNCLFAGATDAGGGNGLAVKDIGLCISIESGCVANRRDGFNYHWGQVGGGGTTLSPHFIEIDCFALGNGVRGSEGNNQGSTAHEAVVGFRSGGTYCGHRDGGNIVDVHAARVWMVNVSCTGSSIVGALLSADPFAGAPGVFAEWWIDGATITSNQPVGRACGDLAVDGYNSKLHYVDVFSSVPVSTRAFSVLVDDDV